VCESRFRRTRQPQLSDVTVFLFAKGRKIITRNNRPICQFGIQTTESLTNEKQTKQRKNRNKKPNQTNKQTKILILSISGIIHPYSDNSLLTLRDNPTFSSSSVDKSKTILLGSGSLKSRITEGCETGVLWPVNRSAEHIIFILHEKRRTLRN